MATILKRPRGYHVRIRRAGYPTISRTFNTREEAKIWIRETERQMDRKNHPDTLLAREIMVAEILEDYRKKVTPRHRGAAVEDKRIEKLKKQPFAKLTLAKLTTAAVEEYIEARLLEVAASTVNRELSILVHALRRARKRGLMHHNPMADVDRPKNPPGRERRLDPDEKAALKKALAKSRNPLFKGFVVIAAETGMRRGELLQTSWSQVKLRHRYIQLKNMQTKNGRGRMVPLTRRATAAFRWLRRQTKGNQYVFEGLTPNAVKLCWRRLCERAEIEDFRLHDLRHERVSSLVESGFNVLEAMAVSGHRDMRAFRGYTHLSTEHLLQKLDQM